MSSEQAIQLAKMCGMTAHPDAATTLRAVGQYVNQEQATAMETEETAEAPKQGPKYFELGSFPTGCAPTGNPKVDDAIRVLRLLHVHRHRHLQTRINEILSNVQMVTGDPKADLKIGRVGR